MCSYWRFLFALFTPLGGMLFSLYQTQSKEMTAASSELLAAIPPLLLLCYCPAPLPFLANARITMRQRLELLIAEALDIDHVFTRRADGAYQFRQFEVDGLGISILGILNQEHDDERGNVRPGVDDQLPGVGEVEDRSDGKPDHNRDQGKQKSAGRSD